MMARAWQQQLGGGGVVGRVSAPFGMIGKKRGWRRRQRMRRRQRSRRQSRNSRAGEGGGSKGGKGEGGGGSVSTWRRQRTDVKRAEALDGGGLGMRHMETGRMGEDILRVGLRESFRMVCGSCDAVQRTSDTKSGGAD